MAGLVKAKKYDWKDSNIANFGSDTDRKVRSACRERYGSVQLVNYQCMHALPECVTGEEGIC